MPMIMMTIWPWLITPTLIAARSYNCTKEAPSGISLSSAPPIQLAGCAARCHFCHHHDSHMHFAHTLMHGQREINMVLSKGPFSNSNGVIEPACRLHE
ncbi:predicted protein [Plenodomus lingam JN3]|uniref:C2H2-type domain-containing protein n=1 Tax=Leptosphaeria maculans (strain JN3 / isolate v23.1.3 / race Av1-4-5-6-7-8) TaxID=985895 RepID=E5A6D5_LEPMJ|nr:predicted protein [Plenodomus lingam JN3]CBX99180.1 predicted protein [Plenodomus lingam JN3]